GKGHWMDREDAEAVPWMAKFTRNPLPRRVVWKQGAAPHERFYWLAVPKEDAKPGAEVRAAIGGQTITIGPETTVDRLTVRLSDAMVDLDKPVTVRWRETAVFEGIAPRTLRSLARTLTERGDPVGVFDAEVDVRADRGKR